MIWFIIKFLQNDNTPAIRVPANIGPVMSLPGVFAGNPVNRNTTGSGKVWEQTEFFSKPRDKRQFNKFKF